jgi:hypothetical protein
MLLLIIQNSFCSPIPMTYTTFSHMLAFGYTMAVALDYLLTSGGPSLNPQPEGAHLCTGRDPVNADMSIRNLPGRAKRGQRVRLITSPQSASRLSRTSITNWRPAAWFTPAPAKPQVYFKNLNSTTVMTQNWVFKRRYTTLQHFAVHCIRSDRVGQFKLFSNNCVHALEIDHSSERNTVSGPW